VGSDQTAGPESVALAKEHDEAAHGDDAGDAEGEHGGHGGHGVPHGKAGTLMLALGALGVVYGDIGTSPLYSI
jgi:hypothetical protein